MSSFNVWFKKYLLFCGAGINALFIALLIFKPSWLWKGQDILFSKLAPDMGHSQPLVDEATIKDELAANFPPWSPLESPTASLSNRVISSDQFPSLQAAADTLKDGDILRISSGVYPQAFILKASNVVVEGIGHVVLDGKSAGGKAAIVNKGDFNQIRNIECRNIKVSAGNGACVRHEGSNLKLVHVYFHNSQQGILTVNKPGLVEIEDSRFEYLGHRGQAHGVYVNGGQLRIRNSLMLAAKSEGHEVKSRAAMTLIENSVIASLSTKDSRLVDVPNGGVLVISRSVLQQGPRSSNQDVIGYGLEGLKHTENKVTMSENIFLLERQGVNNLFHTRNSDAEVITDKNVIIAQRDPELSGMNLYFESRKKAGLEDFPILPKIKD
ncbi:hypothetical protein [Pseudomaricurvus sp.]|uniref:hypothetical protein n=1 Tax=Pseudomaricurvus sp. TaxID=2004510 RepID=UPI003F6D4891